MMMISRCIVAAALLLVISANGAAPPPPPQPIATSYLMVFHWPPTVCRFATCINRDKSNYVEKFKIHGAWPTDSNWVTIPKDKCTGLKFSASRIADIQNLHFYWPTLLYVEDKEFWKHEWEDHGVCSGHEELEYFKKTVDVADKYATKILQAVTNAGMGPGTQLATPQKIRDTMAKETGKLCRLSCKITQDVKRNQQFWLQEVQFCMDENFNLEDCPKDGWFSGCGIEKYLKTTKVLIPNKISET